MHKPSLSAALAAALMVSACGGGSTAPQQPPAVNAPYSTTSVPADAAQDPADGDNPDDALPGDGHSHDPGEDAPPKREQAP